MTVTMAVLPFKLNKQTLPAPGRRASVDVHVHAFLASAVLCATNTAR